MRRVVDDTLAVEAERGRPPRARHLLLGLGYASEWQASYAGPLDIDSGAVIPLLDVGAGASGMALLEPRFAVWHTPAAGRGPKA